MYFTDLPLNEDLLDALYDMHFDECTPVQEHTIPQILSKNDVIGIAQTGTGKTAAYLLPLLTLLADEEHPADAVNALIMAPTRELAKQIDQALQGFSYYLNVNGVAVYGGNDGERYEQERRSLKQGADIVIATPGRLITHLQLGSLDLSRTTHLILDEADRMLDMGFYDDIMKIVNEMPKERQTILFSATMPDKINEMAKTIMRNPVEVKLAVSKPAENIDQSVYRCYDKDKTGIVQHIFKQTPPERVIIFASSKQKVKELNLELKKKGYNVAAMHSDLEQKQRDEVMLAFRAMKIDILVATDIVARGIDIDDIAMVINYDVPRDPEDYVHRIGRTARAGRSGMAITLVNEKDSFALKNIEKLLEKKVPVKPLPEGMEEPKEEVAASKKKSRRKFTKRRGDNKPAKEGEKKGANGEVKQSRKKHYPRGKKTKGNKSSENNTADNNNTNN